MEGAARYVRQATSLLSEDARPPSSDGVHEHAAIAEQQTASPTTEG